MNQNRTVIPGMERAYTAPDSANPTYAPSGTATGNKTYVPGMQSNASRAAAPGNSKPVVGFLYSVSRMGFGEYWPLHVGSNSIGRSSDCQVNLQEATVSEQHANLVIRIMKNPEKVIASICDSQSTCGTLINGESLGFDPRECMNGDVITVGEHYDLYFILIDVKQIGLKVSEGFIPVQAAAQVPGATYPPGTQVRPPVNPYENTARQNGPVPGSYPEGTVGIDGPDDTGFTQPGRTIFM